MRTERRGRDEWERGCRAAAIVLGPAFGLMMAAGILLGW